VSYLTDYARRFDLPVELGSRVHAVQWTDGAYVVELEDSSYEAEQVVIATGPFQTRLVPAVAENVGSEVVQLHSTVYRSPRSLPEGRVLVVGGGNTGFQIAEELSASPEVHLSVGSRQTPLPQRILGRDLFWYLEVTGLIRKTTESRIGRRLSGRDPLIGSAPRRLRRKYGVELHGRSVDAAGSTVRLTTERNSTSRRSCGLPVSAPTIHGSTRPFSTTPTGSCTSAGSRHRPGSTSSACPGSTRAARRFSAGSRTTPSTSRERSPHSSHRRRLGRLRQ
jgi:hypothetical protein